MGQFLELQKEQHNKQMENCVFDKTPLRAPPNAPPPQFAQQVSLTADLLKKCDGDNGDAKPSASACDNESIASRTESEDSLTTKSSSKMSHSKPNRLRSKKRKEQSAKRQETRLRRMLGEDYKEEKHRTPQQAGDENLKRSLDAAGLPTANEDAREIQRESFSRVQKATKKQLREYFVNYTESPEQDKIFITWKEGEPYCTLCNKQGIGHLSGGQHLKKIEEDAFGIIMAGVSQSARRVHLPNGMMEVLTKLGTYKNWGDAIENMIEAARKIINHKGFVIIDQGKKRKVQVPANAITGYQLAMVSYCGNGKYDQSRIVPWDRVPDSPDVVDNNDRDLLTPPQGQGWWPVIDLTLDYNAIDAEQEARWLLICFYQLMGEQLFAWWLGGW